MASLKILQVIPVFSSLFGGPVSVVRTMSKELAKRHDVTVYTTCAIDHYHDFRNSIVSKEEDGYQIQFFPRVFRYTRFNISPTMAKTLRASIKKFDIIHLHSWRNFQDVIVNYYARKYNVPFILQPHGSIKRKGKESAKLLFDRIIGFKIIQNAARVLVLNRLAAKQCIEIGVQSRKVEILPNSITPYKQEELPRPGVFKRKYGINEGERIVLYLGRIHKTKGIDLLLKAYTSLLNEFDVRDAVLVIAGPDDGYFDTASSLVKSLGIEDKVLFTGFISHADKMSSLVDADIFVTPAFLGFPITFLESCATGTPILTTSMQDYLDWIDGKVGYVTTPEPLDLARAMYKILSNRTLQETLSKTCLKFVKDRFSSSTIAERLEQIYESVIKR